MWYVNPTDQVWDKDKSRIVRCSFQCLMPDLRLILCGLRKMVLLSAYFSIRIKFVTIRKIFVKRLIQKFQRKRNCHSWHLVTQFFFLFFLFFFFTFLHLACCICSCWPIITNEFNSVNERHGPVLQFLT